MSVIRIEKTKDYTIMSNYHFKEKEMSLKAKGLLSLMLSLPENWDYSIAGLVAICKENETSIKSALNELKEFGYLEVIKKMPNETKTGRIEYEYIVYEKKQVIEKQEQEKQGIESLRVEVLDIENLAQYNNKQLNTNNKINNNNIYIKDIIDYLNLKTNSNYKHNTQSTQRFIKARLNEGFSVDDFKKVIDNKVSEWGNDDKMCKYLRPETLFGTKFESYLNTKVKDKLKGYDLTGIGSEY